MYIIPKPFLDLSASSAPLEVEREGLERTERTRRISSNTNGTAERNRRLAATTEPPYVKSNVDAQSGCAALPTAEGCHIPLTRRMALLRPVEWRPDRHSFEEPHGVDEVALRVQAKGKDGEGCRRGNGQGPRVWSR